MTTRGALATALLVLALAGCTSGHAEPPASSPSPTASPTASAAAPQANPDDPAVIRATGVPLTSGLVTVTVAAPALGVTPDVDSSARLVVPGGEARLAAPEGMTITALSDGSAVVRDGAGAFVAGLTTEPWGVHLEQVGPEVVRMTTDDDGAGGAWFTSVVVDSATWGQAEGGTSLAVTPSGWARAGSLAAQEGLWAQVVAQAPDADVPGMKAQLECHELGAPDKETWNLEPWRPEVDALEMIKDRCNPE